MPVTIKPTRVAPQAWSGEKAKTNGDIFKEARFEALFGMEEIENSNSKLHSHITPDPNGVFNAIFHAYSDHHHLVLRPDDIWFAILVQLNFYINAHAEELRSFFVSHAGKKELRVLSNGPLELELVELMVTEMTKFMKENINDPAMIEWAIPSFSTTTESDRVVAGVLIMGTLQKYFHYIMEFKCGFPSVTLLGNREDWVKLLAKLDKITQLGAEPTRFVGLLQPILINFLASFDEPGSPDVKRFWNTCVKKTDLGSGSPILTGWLTSFCFWDADGKPILETYDLRSHRLSSRSLGIPISKVPSGVTTVPVTVINMGDTFETQMVAGIAGIEATPEIGRGRSTLNTLRPWTGWSMFKDGVIKSLVDGLFDHTVRPESSSETSEPTEARAMNPFQTKSLSILPGHSYDDQKKWVHKPWIMENWRRETSS